MSSRAADIGLADEFFADRKSLFGPATEFGPKKSKSSKASLSLWEAVWPIASSSGIVESGQLRINHAPASDKPFTLICAVMTRKVRQNGAPAATHRTPARG
jgi:hypothetical protein